ncbi:MAG: hypothetical protein HKN25_14850 [Pyrinomonadaceae bacterium]|nr:hypothetical protein [Pyrinomonadaceae bacterium]
MEADKSNEIQRRTGDLLIEDFTGKTRVQLSPVYAYVWKKCDGRRDTRQIAEEMETELGMKVSEGVVSMTVNRLFERKILIN